MSIRVQGLGAVEIGGHLCWSGCLRIYCLDPVRASTLRLEWVAKAGKKSSLSMMENEKEYDECSSPYPFLCTPDAIPITSF